MTRLEALAAAREHVTTLLAAPKNERGYIVDGWKAPSPGEVNRMVLQTAEFLLGEVEE